MAGARSRRVGALVASLLCITIASPLVMETRAFAQTAGDAKSHLAAGDKALHAKDWATALTEYRAADAAQKSAAAEEGIAVAAEGSGDLGAAYDGYDAYLTAFGASLPKPKRDAAEKHRKDLGDKTGAIVIEVNEAGAAISVDDKPIGTSPVAKPFRTTPGPHRVHATKDGFEPYEQAPNVSAAGVTVLKIGLVAEAKVARVSVKEKAGQAVRVFVDGVDMGPAPWSGDVEPGEHEISARSPTMLAAPQKITVARGQLQEIVVEASSTTATLKVTTDDGKGNIYLDGKLVGEGTFSAEIPSGSHHLSVRREGYEPFEEDLTLKDKDSLSRAVNLKLTSTITTGKVDENPDRLDGLYGAVGVIGVIVPAGLGDDAEASCTSGGPSCSGSSKPLGGGLLGYVGYHFDPVALELFLSGTYDQVSPKLTYTQSSINLGADPARTESFTIRRAGGVTAIRARYTYLGKKIRAGVAGGAGISYRTMFMTRDTSTPDGYADKYLPDAVSYFSPVLTFDGSVGYRLARATTLLVGLNILFESPRSFNNNPTTPADLQRYLLQQGKPPIALTTPAYQLATGVQAFYGLYFAIQFGP